MARLLHGHRRRCITRAVLTGQAGRTARRPMSFFDVVSLLTDVLQQATEAARTEDENQHDNRELHERHERLL